MSLARRYNHLLRRHTLHFAAWNPITDTQRVGDYGILDRGVFRKLGHISEFGVDLETEEGNSASFDFRSAVSSIVRVEGTAQVQVFGTGSVGAKLRFEFQGKFAAVVKSPQVRVHAMQSIHQVAAQLHGAPDWRPRYRVISKVYTGTDATVIASVNNTTGIELSGTADALRQFELGGATVGVTVGGSHQLALVGKKGPLAIDLFRVSRAGAVPQLLGAMNVAGDEPDDLIDGSENWDSEADDLG